MPAKNKFFTHNKTGREYLVLSDSVIDATNSANAKTMVLYVKADGKNKQFFVREYSEFFDGRFTEVK